ncbi:Qat anti-phage system TatD family nuclease QatD [Celeribacter sp.]|uniref:Qat anti-phage system TatD family nuclease QatD n=1 Tax=Celeribacter sp. TaxID=1890673 RepID=UPI003A8E0D2A
MIDFHCHLDLLKDPVAAIEKLKSSRTYVLSVTTTPRAFPKTAKLAKDADRVRTALGLHPQLVGERWRELSLFETLLPETRYIGEIGLDGGKEFSDSFEKQKEVFQSILQICSRRPDVIFSIHSRYAATSVLDHLEKNLNHGTPVLHWFTGTTKELERAIELGCWFSVGEPMLQSKKGLEHIRRMPKGRILTETDAPFTGSEIVSSLGRTERSLAKVWDVSQEFVSEQLRKNLADLAKTGTSV